MVEVDPILWNDGPVLEENGYRFLVPNDYAKRYKLKPEDIKPLIVHTCVDGKDRWVIDIDLYADRECPKCRKKVPDNIQALWTLFFFEEVCKG